MADGRIEYEVRADTSGLDQDLNNVGTQLEGHGSKWSTIMEGATRAIGEGLVGLAQKGVQAAWELGTGFEDGLAKVSTLMDTSVVSMKGVSDGLLGLSSQFGISANDMAQAAYNAVSSYTKFSTDSEGLMQVLSQSATLAKAGFTDIDTAASATLKTMNAYGLGIESVDMIQKVLIQTQNNGITTVGELGSVLSNVTPTAAAMGVSFEQVGAALATMTAQGTPAAQSTTQLNSLFAELGKEGTTAANALAQATEGTQYAGMSFTQLMQAGVPLNEVLQLMRDKADQNGVSMLNMFGSVEAGKAALAMTGENAQSFTNNLQAMSTQADVVGEAFDKVSNTSSEQLARTLAQLQAILIEVFQAISPIIQVALQVASVILQVISSAITPLIQILQPLIDGIVNVGKVFTEQWGTVISGAVNNAKEAINTAFEGIKSFFAPMIEGVVSVGKSFIDGFQTVAQNAMENARAQIGAAFDAIKSFFQPVTDVLTALGQKFVDVMGPIVGGAMNTAKAQIDNVVTMVRGVFDGLIQFITGVFTGNWQRAWQGITNIFGSIFNGIGSMFKSPINYVIDGINSFINSVNRIEIPDWVPVVGGMGFHIPNIPRLKIGMDYVPSDNFPALLHKGEAVLTAAEAQEWRGGSGRGSGADAQEIAAAVVAAVSGLQIPVYLDGREVGRGVEPYVSASQADRLNSRQRSGVRG